VIVLVGVGTWAWEGGGGHEAGGNRQALRRFNVQGLSK
jgi:hypothetical protein